MNNPVFARKEFSSAISLADYKVWTFHFRLIANGGWSMVGERAWIVGFGKLKLFRLYHIFVLFLNIFLSVPHLATFIFKFFKCNCLHYCLHPSNILRQGLNPRPLGHEPSALTTKPWLLAIGSLFFSYIIFLWGLTTIIHAWH